MLLALQTMLSLKMITAGTLAVSADAPPATGQEIGAIAASAGPLDEIYLTRA
jgi:hypothetical protein